MRERASTHVGPAEDVDAALEYAARAIHTCDALLITAGAGIGIDSGLPDFRGTTTGLFKGRTPMSYEQMSDSEHFVRSPAFAWGINYSQLEMYRKAQPHAGYEVLHRFTAMGTRPWFVYTSNIDGHFVKAGFSESRVVTCHGSFSYLQCVDRTCSDHAPEVRAGKQDVGWSADCVPTGLGVNQDSLCMADPGVLEQPCFRCPCCGGLARPNIWFCSDKGYRPRRALNAVSNAYRDWLTAMQHQRRRLVVVEVGAGLTIPSVRVEGEDAVEGAGSGSLLIRINPRDCDVPPERAIGLPLGGHEGLTRLDRALRQHEQRLPSRTR